MTRKLLAAILSLLMIVTLFASMPALAANVSTKIKTTRPGDTLYVRKGPHKGNTPVVGVVKNNAKITLYFSEDEWDPEAWCKIKVTATGAVGYVKNKYVAYYKFDNSDGEIDPGEDDHYDFSDADDNDGKPGSSTTSTTTSSTAKLGTVSTKNGGSVNVRKSATTASAVLATASDGTRLTILSKSGAWYRVKVKGITGYIHGNYVSEGLSGWITARSGLHLRKSASASAKILKTIPYDKYVTVYSKTGNWLYVKYSGTYGYISANYCSY